MNKLKSRRCLVIIAIVILLLIWYGRYLIYIDGPYSGKVVDTESKEPIEGAVVLAVWKMTTCTPGGGVSTYYDAKETITDRNGEFKVPRLTSLALNPLYYLDDLTAITIFKPGYGYFPEYQVSPKATPIGLVKILRKKHPIIELQKLKNMEERKQKGLTIKPESHVPYAKMKNMLKAINEERSFQGYKPYENR
ncbi:MAG: hypothetical protein M0Z67_09205 [Nitrospiraceae bacterium]|nr:hypothetical protein [Nitrospiraceae bacterium]